MIVTLSNGMWIVLSGLFSISVLASDILQPEAWTEMADLSSKWENLSSSWRSESYHYYLAPSPSTCSCEWAGRCRTPGYLHNNDVQKRQSWDLFNFKEVLKWTQMLSLMWSQFSQDGWQLIWNHEKRCHLISLWWKKNQIFHLFNFWKKSLIFFN